MTFSLNRTKPVRDSKRWYENLSSIKGCTRADNVSNGSLGTDLGIFSYGNKRLQF